MRRVRAWRSPGSYRPSWRARRQPDRGSRQGGDTFAATDEAQLLVCGRLDSNTVDADAGDLGDPRAHRIAERPNARCLAHDGNIEMGDAPAALPHPIDRKRQKSIRRRTAPLRVSRRKMRPNVAFGERAQN